MLDKGRFRTIPYPFAGIYFSAGINNRGEIAGAYLDDPSIPFPRSFHGFLRDRRGRFARFDVPGEAGTTPIGLNDRGQIVGNYCSDSVVNCPNGRRGFLRERSGRFVTIRFPGSNDTQASGINNRGQVVGHYVDAAGRFHGFRWEKGRFAKIDVPGAIGTQATDINDRGEVVGSYSRDGRTFRGFLLSGRAYRTLTVAPRFPARAITNINNSGQIVGFISSGTVIPAAEELHGFLLPRGIGGPLRKIDFPGAPRTLVWGLNDVGQIVGLYENPDAAPSRQGSPGRLPMATRLPGAIGQTSPHEPTDQAGNLHNLQRRPAWH